MLFHERPEGSCWKNQLNKLQKISRPRRLGRPARGRAVHPAGFSEERAEATSYSNYSYWGQHLPCLSSRNKLAVALLIALVFVVGFAFFCSPTLPGQAGPNLCEVDPATRHPVPRNIAPGKEGLHLGFQRHRPGPRARIWAGARTSLTIAFFVAPSSRPWWASPGGRAVGYVRQLDFFFTELYNICDNIPSTIILILISYVASPSVQTLAILGMSHHRLDRHGAFYPQPDPHHP